MKILNKGPVIERAAIVVVSLEIGYHLHTGDKGTFLIHEGEEPIGIPRDVMEYLIAEDLIEFTPSH